jgi:mannitol-specific phosphotransferase system IIBC component
MTTPSSPEELRAEIAQTRADLGETAAALAAKADVKQRVKDSAAETKQKAAAKVDEVTQKAAAKVDEVSQSVAAKAGSAAVKAGELRERVADEAVATKRDIQQGDVAAVARRPLPLTAVATIAAAVGVVVLIIRRARR